nr:arginase family protein [Paracoccus sp. EF6]
MTSFTRSRPLVPTARALPFRVSWRRSSLSKQSDVVGADLVEVALAYDPSGITGMLAAQVLLNFLGYIFAARQSLTN